MKAVDLNQFEGKVLVAFLSGQVMVNPTVVKVKEVAVIEERTFLIGTEPEGLSGETNWLASSEVYVAVDAIQQFNVFPNQEAYDEAMAIADEEEFGDLFN